MYDLIVLNDLQNYMIFTLGISPIAKISMKVKKNSRKL